ncbi:hypothetical protein AgCh_002069 [Apium graveolens]
MEKRGDTLSGSGEESLEDVSGNPKKAGRTDLSPSGSRRFQAISGAFERFQHLLRRFSYSDMYAKLHFFGNALKLFDEINEPTIALFNVVISEFSSNGCYKDAFRIFREVGVRKLRLDSVNNMEFNDRRNDIERWMPETNTFHFPFGELTITLEDVYMIMGLPVKGRPVTHRELDAPKAYWMREWQDARLDEAHKRLLPGAPKIAPGVELVWPRALAWAEPNPDQRENPHHHTGQYQGDFDQFEMSWLTWEPYRLFFDALDYSEERYDVELMDASYMSLGRIPLICFEIVEYVMLDRVLRQFSMLQYIPDDPIDISALRRDRLSRWQRDQHMTTLRQYRDEWYAYLDGQIEPVGEGQYVSIDQYMYWYRTHSKLRIARFVGVDPRKIVPRDWYSQDMVDALDCGMRILHAIHSHDPPDWFYECIPEFLIHYDRVNTEWRGPVFSRPSFDRPSRAHNMHIDPSAPPSPHKRTREEFASDFHDSPTQAASKRPRHVLTRNETVVPNAAAIPVHVSHPVQIEVAVTAPPASQSTPLSAPPVVQSDFVQSEVVATAPPASQSTPLSAPPVVQSDVVQSEVDATATPVTPTTERTFGSSELTPATELTPLAGGMVKFGSRSGVIPDSLRMILDTLKSEYDLDSNVVDAYIELLKVRESISGLEPTTKKFFFNFSFFVQLLLKDYCKNLKGCIVPAMLHYLDPSRFDGHKLKVHFVQERPMQSNTHDYGVYVCKYMDAILNGISLRDAVWEPVLGIWTFRYRIAWELSKGLARRISDYGIQQRNRGL